MTKFLPFCAFAVVVFLLVGFCAPSARAAEPFRVTVLMPVGMPMESFMLTTEDSREFLRRMANLPKTDAMVRIDEGSGYRGLVLRTSKGKEYRLYDGIIQGKDFSRRDELRMLERWVLQHGKAEVTSPLIAQLDREVMASRADVAFPLVHNRSAASILEQCRAEGRLNATARVACLHRALSEQLSPKEYADALEKLLIDPPYMAKKTEGKLDNAPERSAPPVTPRAVTESRKTH